MNYANVYKGDFSFSLSLSFSLSIKIWILENVFFSEKVFLNKEKLWVCVSVGGCVRENKILQEREKCNMVEWEGGSEKVCLFKQKFIFIYKILEKKKGVCE